MKLLDTTPAFLALYDREEPLTVEDLDVYYAQYPTLFDSIYFNGHCPRTPERLQATLEKYPTHSDRLRNVIAQLPAIIEECAETISLYLGVEFEIDATLLVGAYGSNAWVDTRCRLYFAVEKLSDDPQHLRSIVMHELGHAFHFVMLGRAGMDWSKLKDDGYTSLYFEGIATYLTQQLVPGLPDWVYYSYEEDGEEWLNFCRSHEAEISNRFHQDLADYTHASQIEWFRLRGGSHFGHNRLGYYLGTEFVKALRETHDLTETMTFWAREELSAKVLTWLEPKRTPTA
ncbi:aminopeptidase [Tumebacillus sp. ITR2]|uniref:Aminopeptidase n=1 Tax=Tumebacillus amylolyticus TaxID=2801339 RepID=A0ABS1J822_9BACL|nr:aminopeptidase [Tumebacillus amylolyticus]MBL0386399.1 aminopeptidase [Tumebacillus amylolyticus]